MTTIQEASQLEAADTGTVWDVAGKRWTKQADGLSDGTTTLPLAHFEGAAKAGLVRDVTPVPVPDSLRDALWKFAQDYHPGKDFDALLTNLGISRVADHRSEVHAWGELGLTAEVLSDDSVHDWLAERLNGATVLDATVRWERYITVVKSGIGCTCHQVERADLLASIPPNYNTLDFEVECDED